MVVVIRPFISGEHMTVPASDRLSQLYTGNGVNTRFDFTFRVFDQEDATGIAVKVDLGTEFETMDESLYQVTINQDNLGGYVVFNTAPSNQTSFYIAGETPVDQALDITNYDNFYPDSIEKSLDKLTAILQEWSHLLGFEEQARKLSNIKYDESAQLRENQIKAELQSSIDFIEQNTSAKLQEAIANGTVSALAITTVESESDLAELIKWDGRTVAVANVGNFKFNSNNNRWERDFITDRQVVTVSSIDELLTLPKWNGRTVYVKSYVAGFSVGGDNFQFDMSLQAINDGGYVINGWKRQKEIEKLTVVDFGAVPNGVTDAMPAVIKMDVWQLSLNDKIGIKFPAGRFALSEWDNSLNQRWNFKVTGVGSQFGYMNNTILIPINPANTNVFKVKARWVEFGRINIEGGNNPATTARHFFKNIITAGQFVRVNCINFSDFGGKGFQFQDTLDCKIDQFYGQDCYDNLLFSMMSGDPNGTWTHSTAIELTNVNIQRHKGATADKCAVFLPRCNQSIMRNVWIEDSIFPMNIAEGEWVIESLNCERCTNPVYAQYAKLNINFKNVLTTFDPTKGEIGNYNGVTRPNWVTSDYEQGTTQIQPHTVDFNSALMTKFQNSRYRFSGNSEWVFLGTYKMQTVGDALEIEIIGLKQFDNIDSNTLISSTTSRQARGRAVISIQNKDNNSGRCTWYAEGSSPITEVRIKTPYAADTDVYVKLAPYVNSAGLFHRTSSTNRMQSGTPFLFNPSLTKVSEGVAAFGSILVPSSFTVNNGTYGFGMDLTNGNLVLDTKITAPNKIPIMVNGSIKYISFTDS